jgi:GNAT superfamily N-acetyltransferase
MPDEPVGAGSKDGGAVRAAVDVYLEAAVRQGRYVPGVSVFDVGGLCCTRSDLGGVWAHALFTYGAEPGEVVGAARALGPGPHLVSVVTGDPDGAVAAYGALGYVPAEPPHALMTTPLNSRPAPPSAGSGFAVCRAATADELDCYNRGLARPVSADEAADPSFHLYYVEADGTPVCRGRAVVVLPPRTAGGSAALCVSRVDTHPDHRRRGLATAVMERAHADAAAWGALRSVLVATEVGVALYKKLGYRVLASVLHFAPET